MNTKHLAGWAATFVVLLAVDMAWLGVIAKDMYQQGMGDLMSPDPRLAYAAVFYLIYPVGLMIFAISPSLAAHGIGRAALMGALFGMFCYATYDLTNMAVVRNWPIGLSFIDIAWGIFVSGVASAAGAFASRKAKNPSQI